MIGYLINFRIYHFENILKFKLIISLNTNNKGITKLQLSTTNEREDQLTTTTRLHPAGSQERDLSRGGGERLHYQE